MRLRLHLSIAIALLSAAVGGAQTVGLLRNEPGAAGGYTLFTPLQRPETYLIDERGRVVHTWPGASHAIVYLLEDSFGQAYSKGKIRQKQLEQAHALALRLGLDTAQTVEAEAAFRRRNGIE